MVAAERAVQGNAHGDKTVTGRACGCGTDERVTLNDRVDDGVRPAIEEEEENGIAVWKKARTRGCRRGKCDDGGQAEVWGGVKCRGSRGQEGRRKQRLG